MLVVLSLNTALDRVSVVPALRVGEVHRTEQTVVYAGGKGLNVARVLRSLGQPVQVIGFLGGAPAPFIAERCEALGIKARWIATAGESRTCLILVDRRSGRQTVINEPGPRVTDAEVAELSAALDEVLQTDDVLAIAGSAPPGVPDSLYAEVISRSREHGVRVLMDASGEALRCALGARPWAVTPNLEEARATLGASLTPPKLALALGAQADIALLTLGAEGVLYGHHGQLWRLQPPPVSVVNAVGSGDAFVAGFLAGIAQGRAPLAAARLGVACGASNAARLEPGIGPAQEIECIDRQVKVSGVS